MTRAGVALAVALLLAVAAVLAGLHLAYVDGQHHPSNSTIVRTYNDGFVDGSCLHSAVVNPNTACP